MNGMLSGVINVAVALVGLAALAVIVGKNAKTADVINATGGAFSDALRAAEGPVLDATSISMPRGVGLH